MPDIQSDGARLYYEAVGTGTPIVFLHEFSGDLWSWEKQIQHFSRRYRCVAFNARGYPPSEVPESPSRYSHKHAVDDVAVVMRRLEIGKAPMIGIGSGGDPRNAAAFKRDAEARARLYEEGGLAEVLKRLRKADNRIQLKRKNPRAFEDFCRRFMQHSAQGCAHITRRVMARRPSLFSMERALRAMKTPVHVVVGDEDPGALSSGLFMKQVSPAVRLSVLPATGHLVNLEEPDLFHRLTEDFFALVESKKWRPRGR